MSGFSSTHLHQLIWDSDKWSSDCNACNATIFGLIKPGVRCIQCRKVFHRHCVDSIGSCFRECQETGSGVDKGHYFELQQYFKPTDCDVCKMMLVGLFKQGLQCVNCQYNIHEKCKPKVVQECLSLVAKSTQSLPAAPPPSYSSWNPNPIETSSACPVEMSDRRSEVFRLFEEIPLVKNTSGKGFVLREELVLQSRDNSLFEEKYWKLDSKFLHIYGQETKKDEMMIPEISIPLNEIINVKGMQDSGCDFIVQTESYGNFYVTVANLRKYTSELGFFLKSTWETTIKEAVTAFSTDLQNPGQQLPKNADSLKNSSTSDVKYNIMSERIIGSGQFGKVYEGIEVETSKRVAVKIIDKNRFNVPPEKRNEVRILKDLSHPNIVRLLQVYEKTDVICIFMEILDGGDLLEYILTKPDKKLSERLTRLLLYQTFTAINYLHMLNIVHCDIKPENILLVSTTHNFDLYLDPFDPSFFPIQAKLCDFGYSRIISENSLRSSLVGTPAYLGPEIMGTIPAYDRSLDLWSAGVCIYVCLTGTFPFNSRNSILEISANQWKLFPIESWQDISFSCIDLIHKLLQVNPKARYSSGQALQHPWLNSKACKEDLLALEKVTGLKGEWIGKNQTIMI